jgi:pimeloyl-ACP methyl ester carboxylesterase
MSLFRIAPIGAVAAQLVIGEDTSALVLKDAPVAADVERVQYGTVKVDGLDIWYREAGPRNAPAVLLLHGFPSSSHMFRTLIPLLAKSYRVVAFDYPGFGYSSMPDRSRFAYTFENLAHVADKFTAAVGLSRYALYVMDYGAPIGFRLAMLHPERVSAIIVQNGNAYEEGLRDFWTPIKAYWADPTEANRNALRQFLQPASTKWQYTNGVPDPSFLSPDAWTMDQAGIDRSGNAEIQLDLFYDYRRNVDLYPKVHEYFRKYQPPALVVWGKNDVIFPVEGAIPYKRDLPKAELHLLDTGHFALETHAATIAALMNRFLEQHVKEK